MKLMPALIAMIAVLALALLAPCAAVAAPNLCVTRAGTPDTAPQPAQIEGATPYVFKTVSGQDLRLHVFSPPNPGRHPARPR